MRRAREAAKSAAKGSIKMSIQADRYLGCLLGGAAGDALGYPVEFNTESEIFSTYGKSGITLFRFVFHTIGASLL